MIMAIRWSRVLLLLLTCVLAPANAQNAAESTDGTIEEIVVTGSRIPRDEFSSPSPIQVLDVDSARQIGIMSISEMLQRSPVANGTQIDASLNTNAGNANATEGPSAGGVGSSNISLRGLAPERTLILVNGRRMGSVGVRGAPAQPDISLIPFDMVDRVEVLTGGVSAIYGADAVAGVVNVWLRDEFDGFELSLNTEQPADKGGAVNQVSMIAGTTSEQVSIMFAAEYYDRERIITGDRDYAHCYRFAFLLESGERREDCANGFLDNMVMTEDFDDTLFYTPDGTSDSGVPNFATWQVAVPDPTVIDPAYANLGPINYIFFDRYNDQDERRASDLVGEQERISVVTTGKVSVDWWSNEEVFFETYYLNSKVFSIATTEQIFPGIPGQVPQEDVNGNIIVDASGAPVLVPNPMNPFGTLVFPVVTLESVPQTRDVEREQFRFVAGLNGDFGNSSWSYEGFYSYDRGIGFQAQPILFENHLILSTQTVRLDANGDVVCGINSAASGFDTPNPCVPLNMFADDIYIGGASGEGVFSDAEYNYLVGNRTNRTVVEQTMFGAFATGELFEIGGERVIAAALGGEYRIDEIDSQNDISGVMGLNAAENPLQEGSTTGDRDIFEVFAEINVPLLENLEIDAALRYTDEENFGSADTWRARIAYKPTDYLTISGSAGTSYRAPNLREQFLAGQGGGASSQLDPCRAREIGNAIAQVGPQDPDVQLLIGNCVAAGVPFVDSDGDGYLDQGGLGIGGTTINTRAGGNATALPETSDSYTATILFRQPWTERFDFEVALSYWSIEIENTLEEFDAGAIISECYTNIDFPNGTSPFCSRHTRFDGDDGSSGQINFIDVSFINFGLQTAKGFDLNTRLAYTFENWGLDLSWMTATTKQLELETEILSPEDRDDDVGEIGTPELKFNSTLSLRLNDWEFMMQNRYIDAGKGDTEFEYEPIFYLSSPTMAIPITFVGSVWYTDMSLTYGSDSWSVSAGVNNLFDENPPIVRSVGGQGSNRNGAVTSSGYDLIGRSYFASLQFGF